MAEMRDELTLEDFVALTKAVRLLKPELANYFCTGVEKPRLGDMNVVFHFKSLLPNVENEVSIVMISADLMLTTFGKNSDYT
jgi:hypothetical protein